MSGTTPDDEQYHLAGMAGLYALDALEGEDLARFEELLATNVELQEEVAGFRATAARLSEASATDPPPDLRDRVLTTAAATRQDAPVTRLGDRRRGGATRRRLLAAAAAVAVVAAGLGGYLVAEGRGEPASELAQVLAETDARVVPLTGVDSSDAAGHVVVSKDAGHIVIVSNQMPPAAEGRTYELWKIDGEGVHKAGLFEPDERGYVEAVLPVSLDGATGFAITDEPDGGSPQATTPILMQAELT